MQVVIDIETTGLNRYKDKINICGVYVPEYNFFETCKTPEELNYLLSTMDNPTLIYANGKFDTLFLEEQWKIAPEKLTIDEDIMIMAYIVDMGKKKGLKDLAQRYCGADDWDISKKEKTNFSETLVEYNFYDCYWTYKVYEVLHDIIVNDERMNRLYYKLAMPAFRAYRNIERRGMYIDIERTKKLIVEYNKKADSLEQELKSVADINWNSTKQVAEVFFNQLEMPILARTELGSPSVGAEQLKEYASRGYTVAQTLLDYKTLKKSVGTFLEPWLEQQVNSRIHPNFNIDTVRTGRTSCSNPNLQQVPRDINLRSLFVAPEGKELFECDYSQLELRIACEYANEKTMLHAYLNNEDLHTRTAKICTGKTEVTKAERRDAKPVNFGFIYGMSAKGYVEYSKASYGIVVSEEKAKELRARFFETYSDLPIWYEKQKYLCRQYGGVYTLFGRFRALNDIYSNNYKDKGSAERCCINTPVQSTGSDILLSAMLEVENTLPECEIVCTVHDSILMYVPKNKIEYYKEKVGEIMKKPKMLKEFDIELKTPLDIDIGAGPWGTH